MSLDRCILSVHAHPDDESSKGAGTVARYVDAGARAVLVCCTGGEEGEVLNPALDADAILPRLAEVRREELANAAAIIGYDTVHWLGYRDSGMADAEANAHPDCFAAADLDEAIGRLVSIIRAERPHVVVTYSDDQGGYQHPDHLRVHDISVPAFRLAADPLAYRHLGDPWQPAKLYYVTWARARMLATHQAFLDNGLESPFDETWFERPSQDHRITTKVEVAAWYQRREQALLAHATQVDPTSKFWFGLPSEIAAAAYPWEDYILAESLVETDVPEDDIFAGFNTRVS